MTPSASGDLSTSAGLSQKWARGRSHVVDAPPRFVVEGPTAAPSWVAPVAVGVAVFGVVAWGIATGFCFSCAAPGYKVWPVVLVPLLGFYLRSFRLTVGEGEVVVEQRFAGATFRRYTSSNAQVIALPDRAGARFAAAVMLQQAPARTVMVGDVRDAAWVAAAQARLREAKADEEKGP